MAQGWISLHRKILDNPIVCKDSDYFSIWCYILLNATHTNYDTYFAGKRFTLKPGQLITSRKSIATKFNISESKVQRVLKKLEIEQQIEQQTTSEKRLISIVNWQSYQESEQQTEQQVNSERTTTEQQVNNERTTTEQQVNNERTTTEQQVNTNNNGIIPITEIMEIRENNKTTKKEVSHKEQVPYEDIVSMFNRICTSLSSVKSISQSRKNKMRVRWSELKDLETFEILFKKVQESNFLKGDNKNKWKASFDWLMENDSNYVKVFEDNYKNKNDVVHDQVKEIYDWAQTQDENKSMFGI